MENLVELSDKELCYVRVGLSTLPLMGKVLEVMRLIGKLESELERREIVMSKIEVPHGKNFRSHKEFKKNDELVFTTEHGKPF
jgi:hypothetical protein